MSREWIGQFGDPDLDGGLIIGRRPLRMSNGRHLGCFVVEWARTQEGFQLSVKIGMASPSEDLADIHEPHWLFVMLELDAHHRCHEFVPIRSEKCKPEFKYLTRYYECDVDLPPLAVVNVSSLTDTNFFRPRVIIQLVNAKTMPNPSEFVLWEKVKAHIDVAQWNVKVPIRRPDMALVCQGGQQWGCHKETVKGLTDWIDKQGNDKFHVDVPFKVVANLFKMLFNEDTELEIMTPDMLKLGREIKSEKLINLCLYALAKTIKEENAAALLGVAVSQDQPELAAFVREFMSKSGKSKSG